MCKLFTRFMKQKNGGKKTKRQEDLKCKKDENEYEIAPCVVCLIEKRTRAFLNCGHFCICEMCVKQVPTCPICRKTSDSMQIYLS